jgi:hypothetical protein
MTFSNASSAAFDAANGLAFHPTSRAKPLNLLDVKQTARLSLSSIFLLALKMHLIFKIWLLIFLEQRLTRQDLSR